MSNYDEINDIAMNPRSDEYMDIDKYNSLARASHPEYGGFESSKKSAVKKGSRVSSLILKADLIATVALVTAVVGPSFISNYFEDTFSPITCEFVETIALTNEIDYYLHIDSLEKTVGDVEIKVSSLSGYNATFPAKEGKNIGEITGLTEDTVYTISLYDGGYLVKKTDIRTITEREREERAWRKFFENFLDIYYDKDRDVLGIKMKVVDDLDRYEMLTISLYDNNEGFVQREVEPEEKDLLQEIPLGENEIYGNEIHISIMGFLKYIEEEENETWEDFLYEGVFYLDGSNPVNEHSDVYIDLVSALTDRYEIDYYFNAMHITDNSNVELRISKDNDVLSTRHLEEGKNIGKLYDLEEDTIYLFEIYDSDILINSYEIKTLSASEIENRNLTQFYPEFIDITYDNSDTSLYITMKVIDDNEKWISYQIIVSDSNSEDEITFEASEAGSSHRFILWDSNITDSIIEIKFIAYSNGVTAEASEELCTIEYNIAEGTYDTK